MIYKHEGTSIPLMFYLLISTLKVDNNPSLGHIRHNKRNLTSNKRLCMRCTKHKKTLQASIGYVIKEREK